MRERKPKTAARKPTARRRSRLDSAVASLWTRCDRLWLHLSAIVVLTVGVFANTLKNSYHLDDFYRVVDNPGITQISRPWQHFVDPTTMSTLDRIAGYRPLLPLSLSINFALGGTAVFGYHVGNLALQVVAAALVYLLVLKILTVAPASKSWRIEASLARALALCVALVFAVHPVSGIPVNYICARDQLMSQLLWSGSLLCYLRMHERGFNLMGWLATLGLLAASLLAKGDAVVAPVLILALHFTVLAQPFKARRPWLHAAAFALPVACLFLVQAHLFGQSEVAKVVAGTSRWSYALTQATVHVFRYLPQFVWPFSIRQDPWIELEQGLSLPVICGLLVIAISLGLAWRWRRVRPIESFCILAYWIMLAPTSSVIPLHAVAVDYRPYGSSPFLFLAIALTVLRIEFPARSLVAAGAIVWCAASSVMLNRTWLTDTTLWAYSVEHGGGALAHHNLGMATADLARRRTLLEQALKIGPNYILAMINLGRVLVVQNEVSRGLAYLDGAVRMDPNNAQSRYWYARTLVELQRKPEASRESVLAARLAPRDVRAVTQAALATQAAGDSLEASHWLNVLMQLRGFPRATAVTDTEASFAHGFALQSEGKLDEAIAEYRQILTVDPNHVQVRFNLGHALMTKQACQLAIPEFERVLQLDAGKAAAHLHLATCARVVGDASLAQLHQARWEESQQSSRR